MSSRVLISPCFLIIVFFSLSPKALATSSTVVLNEIHITGGTGHTDDDFVELYNPTSVPIEISDFRLRYKNSKGTEGSLRVFGPGSCVPAQGFFLWANSKGVFAPLADTTTSGALSNDYSILLYPKEGTTPLDTVSFGTGTALPNPGTNQSLSRNTTDLIWSLTTTPTPTKSIPCPPQEPTPPPIPTTTSVRLNELLPNPSDEESAGEFIELYNDSDTETDIGGFILHDASQSGSYTFPKDILIAGRGYLVIPGNISKIALNNSNETLSLFDPAQTLVDSVHYDTTKENVSLNFTESGWRGGTPTPGASNQLNTLPETRERVPKEGYRSMPVSFDAQGKDVDGNTLKYTWDFGDGHKSYLEKTSHTYEANGTYQVTLKTTDGSDDVIETFSIKIESFPKLDIRITALVPNPAGKDSDNEWLIIENREKKSVNLEGWSIATGWDNLVNHPIRKSFIVKGKSTAKLTRDFSLFTLPNKKGRIELRAPNGKTLQEIEYKDKQSIEEDLIYRKEKGKRWEWQKETPKTTTTAETADTPELLSPETFISEEIVPVPEEAPLEENQKSTDPTIANQETYKKENLRQELSRLLYRRTWVEVPQNEITSTYQTSGKVTATQSKNLASTLLEKIFSNINFAFNNWQNKE
ncbi:MAG: lamin tail domain-containing protein [Candidatus Moranbacteria bacterium]|nr:lamin tail domain-containing protein [Candidatus Moranbacteria bacterium]